MDRSLFLQALDDPGFQAPVTGLPYAEFLGLRIERHGAVLHVHLPFKPELIGGPARLHGGVTGAILEVASVVQLLMDRVMQDEALPDSLPKPIGLTVDYLRAGMMEDVWARAQIVRRGRRIATVRAEAWQKDPSAPIACANLRLMIPGQAAAS